VPSNDRSRSGLSDYRTSKTSAPGISSRLLPKLLSEIVYIDILDVAAFMPPLFEYPEVVSLADDELIAVGTTPGSCLIPSTPKTVKTRSSWRSSAATGR
jgi:hypothetical protein